MLSQRRSPAAIAETKGLVYRHAGMSYLDALREAEVSETALALCPTRPRAPTRCLRSARRASASGRGVSPKTPGRSGGSRNTSAAPHWPSIGEFSKPDELIRRIRSRRPEPIKLSAAPRNTGMLRAACKVARSGDRMGQERGCHGEEHRG